MLADGGHTGAAATRLELGSAASRHSVGGSDVKLPAASTMSTGEPVPEALKSTGVAAACLEVDSARLRVPSTESSVVGSFGGIIFGECNSWSFGGRAFGECDSRRGAGGTCARP